MTPSQHFRVSRPVDSSPTQNTNPRGKTHIVSPVSWRITTLPSKQPVAPLRALRRADSSSDLGTDMVTLLVGPARVKFIVHKELLVRQAIFFCGSPLAIGASPEADEGVVTLEDDDPDAFRLLVGWLYQGHIPRVRPSKPGFSESPQSASPGRSLPAPPATQDQDVDMEVTPEESDPKTDSREEDYV